MIEILRRLTESARQGWIQGERKANIVEREKRGPLTPQEREKSMQARRLVIVYAEGILGDNDEAEATYAKDSVLKIKRGRQLGKEDSREGSDITISNSELRQGTASTYLFNKSYAFYPNNTYIFMSQSRIDGKKVICRDEMREEAREEDLEDLKKLLSCIKSSQSQIRKN